MAGPSYFDQLKTYLTSAESRDGSPLILTNPDNSEQTVEIALQTLPDRPDGWPADLPEPVMLEGEHASGIAYVNGDDGEPYLLLRDPASGAPVAMTYDDLTQLYASMARPIIEAAKADTMGFDPYRNEELPSKHVYSPDLVEIEGGPQDGAVLRQAVLAADGTIERFGGNHIGAQIVLVDPSLREGDTPDNPITRDSVTASGSTLKDVMILSRTEIENAVLLEQIRDYTNMLIGAVDRDSTTGINFGNVPVAEISAAVEVRAFEAPASEPVVVVNTNDTVPEGLDGARESRVRERVAPSLVDEGEADVTVTVEHPPQDVIPEPVEGYNLADELAGIRAKPLETMEGNPILPGKAARVLETIRRELGTPPDLDRVADFFDGRDPYKTIEDGWQAVAAQYIHDSVEAGAPMPLGEGTAYHQAIAALEQGRVEDARTLLDGGEPEAVVEEVYSPGAKLDGVEVADIEPASGDADTELSQKVEAVSREIEWRLSALEDYESAGNDCVDGIIKKGMLEGAIASVRTNFADAISENGVIDISKLPVEPGDDLHRLAERMNEVTTEMNEQYGLQSAEDYAASAQCAEPPPGP